jgi:hypothetical protein
MAHRLREVQIHKESKLQTMPWWIISLWVAVVGAVYGIKATELKHMGGKK